MSDYKYTECPNCGYAGSRNVYKCNNCGFEGCWDTYGGGCWPGQSVCPNCERSGGRWDKTGYIEKGA